MSMRDGNVLIGWGMATATYPTNQEESSAKVQVQPDGRAIVSAAGHDLGTGAYTIFTQVAGETLGLPAKKVKVMLGDSTLPEAPVAGGSQTSASVGSAIKAACLKAVQQVKERAAADPQSPLFQRQASELVVGDERVFVKDDPATGEAIATLLQRNGNRPIEAQADVSPPKKPSEESPVSGPGLPVEQYSKHAWGAQFIEVRIHPRLGEIRVSRAVGAFAGGKILNAKTARSQIMGGIVMGIGMGLLEHTMYDPVSGKIVTDNLADYLVAVNADIPKIDCFFVDEPDEHVNPLGCKGIGELGVTGVAAAISNAVYHATGKRLRDLPITLDKILA
jgi:xanthine dehydrogenase YagR molybdenum-binding subunit